MPPLRQPGTLMDACVRALSLHLVTLCEELAELENQEPEEARTRTAELRSDLAGYPEPILSPIVKTSIVLLVERNRWIYGEEVLITLECLLQPSLLELDLSGFFRERSIGEAKIQVSFWSKMLRNC